MAMIVCPNCQLEYDSADPYCLYCGNPTPSIQKLKGKLITIFIIVALLLFTGLLFIERIEGSLDSNNVENNVTPTASDSISPPLAQQNSNPSAINIPSIPNQSSTLNRYIARANTLLEPISQAQQLPQHIPYDSQSQTYIYPIHTQATLAIKTTGENEEILSVEINNSNTRKNESLITKITIAAFRGILPSSIKAQNIRTQLTNLHEQATNKRNCNSVVQLEDYYLFERYNRSRHTSIIGISTQKPDDICND